MRNVDLSFQFDAATHHSRMDTNVYEGKSIRGQVVVTISRGRLVWYDGQLNVQRGTGRFIPMPPGGSLFEGLEQQDLLEVMFPYGPLPVQRDSKGHHSAVNVQGSCQGGSAPVASTTQQEEL